MLRSSLLLPALPPLPPLSPACSFRCHLRCQPPSLLDSGHHGIVVSQSWPSQKAPIPPPRPGSSQCPTGVWLDRGTQEVGRSLALLPTTPPPGRDSGDLAVCPRPGCPVACPLGGSGEKQGSWEWAVSGPWMEVGIWPVHMPHLQWPCCLQAKQEITGATVAGVRSRQLGGALGLISREARGLLQPQHHGAC